jgi:adenylate kinase family enzyme
LKRKIILMFGPPCSGKSTVGRQLAERLGFAHIITSDLLNRYREDTRATMAAGDLAPDDIMIPVLDRFVPRSGGLVIDSLRSPAQVRWLKGAFPGPDVRTFTFHFEVSEREIRRRLEAASRTDRGVRADDGAIVRRLGEYHRYSLKTVPFLLGWTLYERIDANQSLEDVSRLVFSVCDAYGVGATSLLTQA